MSEYPKKYRLKLRSEGVYPRSFGNNNNYVNNVNKSKTEDERISLKTTLCVIMLLGVIFLKTSGGDYGEDFLSKIDSLINSQFDIEKTTQVMAEFVEDASEYFSGNKDYELSMPVEGGKVYEDFTQTVHPVFMTDVSPTGITLAAEPSAYVYSALPGKVTSVRDNADGTKRIIVKYDKNTSLAYDNLSSVYVKEDTLIDSKHIIGLLKEEEPATLIFEMWVDNEAVDPMKYISGDISGEE